MAEEGMNVLRQALAATQSTDTAQRKKGDDDIQDELRWLRLELTLCPVVVQHTTVVYCRASPQHDSTVVLIVKSVQLLRRNALFPKHTLA